MRKISVNLALEKLSSIEKLQYLRIFWVYILQLSYRPPLIFEKCHTFGQSSDQEAGEIANISAKVWARLKSPHISFIESVCCIKFHFDFSYSFIKNVSFSLNELRFPATSLCRKAALIVHTLQATLGVKCHASVQCNKKDWFDKTANFYFESNHSWQLWSSFGCL